MKLTNSIEFTFAESLRVPNTNCLRAMLTFLDEMNISALEPDVMVDRAKWRMKQRILDAIQPRSKFEAAFHELRSIVKSCESLDTRDAMKIMGAIVELSEKLRLN